MCNHQKDLLISKLMHSDSLHWDTPAAQKHSRNQKLVVHLCQQGGEAYLLAIFLRMRRMILPDLVFGSPVRCTDEIRTQDCCCNGLNIISGLSSSTRSVTSLLPRKSSLRVPL